MKTIRARVLGLFSLWIPTSEWPFMLFLTFVFVFIYAWTVVSSVRLREPLMLVVFTVLFTLHLGLTWASIWWMKKGWNTWLHIGIQTISVFILCSIAAEIGPMLGLYLALVGESVGQLGSVRRIAAGVLGVLAVSAVNYYWITRGTGMVWWALAVIPMTAFIVIYVVLYSRQAAAREKAQHLLSELEAANRRLTESADQIEDLTLANERQRMARELHDTLAQGLAGLVLQLEAADLHLSGGRPERAQTIVQQAMARARATLAESRRAIDGLRKQPPADLEAAVRAEVDHFKSITGLPCALEGSLPGSLSAAEQELVVRTVAEGLTNISRHAGARHTQIRFLADGKMLAVEIADDGIGFDPAHDPDRAGHYGLTGLRERAAQAGGALEMESSAGKGSMLRMRIPVSSTKEING
jgi:two-component system, NarL family, sensor histidine kinase YdfH